MSFSNDLLSQNTNVIPLIRIGNGNQQEDDYYSINQFSVKTNVDGELGSKICIPLILNIPSIKQSFDLETKKFKTSLVSLQLSNYEYNGEILSDTLFEKGFVGKTTYIYYKSQTTDFIDDMYLAYKGVVKKIKHDDAQVTFELEDFSESISVMLPKSRTPNLESLHQNHRNKPIPIVYGVVDKAPALLVDSDRQNEKDLIFDSSVNNNTQSFILFNDSLSVLISDEYHRVKKQAANDNSFFGTEYESVIQQYYSLQPGVNQNKFSLLYQYNENDIDGTDFFGSNTIANNEIIVSNVTRPVEINPFSGTQLRSIKHDKNSVQKNSNGDFIVNNIDKSEFDHNSEYPIYIRSIILNQQEGEWNNLSPSEIVDSCIIVDEPYPTATRLRLKGGCLIKMQRLSSYDESLKSYGILLSDIYSSYFGHNSLGDTSPNNALTHRFGGNKNADHDGTVGVKNINLISTIFGTEITDGGSFDISASGEIVGLKDLNDGEEIFGDSIRVTENLNELSLYAIFPSPSNSNKGIIAHQFKINDVKLRSYAQFDKMDERKFFADVCGRVVGSASNPITIIKQLMIDELDYTSFNNNEYIKALNSHSNWYFGFSINKEINSKKLIEELFKSTKSFPKFNSDGSFGFGTIEDKYDVSSTDSNVDTWENSTLIKESDIIKYSFDLSDIEQIYNKVEVNYHENYNDNEFLEKTSAIIALDRNVNVDQQINISDNSNNIVDFIDYSFYDKDIPFDSKFKRELSFESKFIRNSNRINGIGLAETSAITPMGYINHTTAENLRDYLYYYHKNQHLIIELELPLNYIELEIGSTIKFEKLLNGVLAYGIDYTNIKLINEQYRYPMFIVTSVSKSIDKLNVICEQLHHLRPYSEIDQEWFNEDIFTNPDKFEISEEIFEEGFFPGNLIGISENGLQFLNNATASQFDFNFHPGDLLTISGSPLIHPENRYIITGTFNERIDLVHEDGRDFSWFNLKAPNFNEISFGQFEGQYSYSPFSFNPISGFDGFSFNISDYGYSHKMPLMGYIGGSPKIETPDHIGKWQIKDENNTIAIVYDRHATDGIWKVYERSPLDYNLSNNVSAEIFWDLSYSQNFMPPHSGSLSSDLFTLSSNTNYLFSIIEFANANAYIDFTGLTDEEAEDAIVNAANQDLELSQDYNNFYIWIKVLGIDPEDYDNVQVDFISTDNDLVLNRTASSNPLNLGDVNNDNGLNVLDVVQLVNHAVGVAELSEENQILGDMNQDGAINVLDIVTLVGIILND